jgi:hypothetical protein
MKALRIAFGVFLIFVRVHAQEKLAVIIMPEIYLEVGETRQIDTFIRCISEACTAFETTLSYDPAVVQIKEAHLGSFLGEQSLIVKNEVDNQNGTVHIAATTLGDIATNNTTVLVSLQVESLAEGVSQLSVDQIIVADPIGNPLEAVTFNGSVTVSSSPLQEDLSGTITFWGYPNADLALQAVLPAFHQAYPSINVEAGILDNNEAHERLKAALLTGENVPDVALVHEGRLQEIINTGGLENLAGAPYKANQYANDFVEWIWQLGVTPDGQVLAIPERIGPGAFFYRRDLFEAAGLPSDPEIVAQMTQTWEGFLDVCARVSDPANSRWCLSTANEIVYSTVFIGRFFDENDNPIINTAEVVRLVEYAKRIRSGGMDIPVAPWTPKWEELITSDSIAIQYAGSWFGGSLQSWLTPADGGWSGKWGVFPVPETPGQNRGSGVYVLFTHPIL